MDFDNPRMCEVFFDIFEALPRVGPGNAESTLRALNMVGRLPDKPLVLDLGCGPGRQTFDLAEALPTAQILAVDLHKPFLDRIQAEAQGRGLKNRVRIQQADMSCLDLKNDSFDLIWSEGAAYSIGFARALDLWRPLLKPGASLAVSEATWFRPNRPREVAQFWEAEYPGMLDVAGCLGLFPSAGFEVVGSFPLPEQAWWDDFYTPMVERLERQSPQYQGDPITESVIGEIRSEIEIFQRYAAWFGYTFVIARKGQSRA